jgi:hypothetical protein
MSAVKNAPERAGRARSAARKSAEQRPMFYGGGSASELSWIFDSLSPEQLDALTSFGLTLVKTGKSIRGAFAVRSLEAVSRMALKSSEDTICRAVSAPTDIGALARAVSEEAASPAVSELDEKAELLARGAELKEELIRRAGGYLSASEVSKLLGISRQAVDKRRRSGKLIAVPIKGDNAYPRCQFDREGVILGLQEALSSMPIESPWMRLEWLLTPDDALSGRSPLDALKAGDRESVLRIARGHGA